MTLTRVRHWMLIVGVWCAVAPFETALHMNWVDRSLVGVGIALVLGALGLLD